MRGKTIDITLALVSETCCACDMVFAIPADFRQRRMNDHQSFYCPAGHAQSYVGKSEAEKLREANRTLEDRLRWAYDRAEGQERRAEAAERKAAAHKGVATKLRKRAAAGVCPCCNRHFDALERHMATKHPEFVAEAKEHDLRHHHGRHCPPGPLVLDDGAAEH